MADSESRESVSACPCGSGQPYAVCCEPLHKGAPAASAEALMRSRYSAFCLNLSEYIARTWHPSTRLTQREDPSENPRWIGLRIMRRQAIDDDHAVVEFMARYKLRGRVGVLHEISRFVREDGQWFYLDGKFPRQR